MAQVSWSPSSLIDLDSIAESIARDSTHYASLFVQRIVAYVEKLSEFSRDFDDSAVITVVSSATGSILDAAVLQKLIG
jgi:plasmid stabilization system protein ParE